MQADPVVPKADLVSAQLFEIGDVDFVHPLTVVLIRTAIHADARVVHQTTNIHLSHV
jgi:hypothetical protein